MPIRSSYTERQLNYGDYIKGVCFAKQPKYIVEFGILDGYSLRCFLDSVDADCKIDAYDIFDEFVGNHSEYEMLKKEFEVCSHVRVAYGDFYKSLELFNDDTIDIMHIDIANTGDIIPMVSNYLSKVKKDGIIILEGGSKERDTIEWMRKYNKMSLYDALKGMACVEYYTCGTVPSITIIRKK